MDYSSKQHNNVEVNPYIQEFNKNKEKIFIYFDR